MAIADVQPNFLASIIREKQNAASPLEFEVLLFKDGVRDWHDVTLSLDSGFAGAALSGDTNAQMQVEVWTIVLEKAFLEISGRNLISDDGGDPASAWRALVGAEPEVENVSSLTDGQILQRIESKQNNGYRVLIGTELSTSSLIPRHMYLAGAISDSMPNRKMVLYNPHGSDRTVIYNEAYATGVLASDVKLLYYLVLPN